MPNNPIQDPLFKPTGFVAAADLSSYPNRFMRLTGLNTAANQPEVNVCNADGQDSVGVLDPYILPTAAGQAVTLISEGWVVVTAGSGGLTVGDYVKTDNAGKAIVCHITLTGADSGDFALGQAYSTAAENELVTVKLGVNFKVQ